MLSLTTNVGAMGAVQSFFEIAHARVDKQLAVATGQKISGPKGDGAVYEIAQGLLSDITDNGAKMTSMDRTRSVLDVAMAGIDAINEMLVELESIALSLSSDALSDNITASLKEGWTKIFEETLEIASEANFDDVNLIDGSTLTFQALFLDTIDGRDVLTELQALEDPVTDDAAGWDTMRTDVRNLLEGLSLYAAELGTHSKIADSQTTFLMKHTSNLERLRGRLIDAELEKDDAALQTQSVKAQLAVQTLSIANAAPRTILQFFQ